MAIKVGSADEAHTIFEEIANMHGVHTFSCLKLGSLLREVKLRKLFKMLGHDTFQSFLADPDIGISKSSAYLYMLIHRFFVEDRNINPEKLWGIEATRLRDIVPIIKGGADCEEWISFAKHFSKKDFIDSIREFYGKTPMEIKNANPEDNEVAVSTDYIERCKVAGCIICDGRPVDLHHFPKTKGAGSDDERVIPVCRGCHIQAHANPKEWLWQNRMKIFDYFYARMK